MSIIISKHNLYNDGLCFTKGKEYELNTHINHIAQLMDISVINDQGEKHFIGSWWRLFTIKE